MAYANVSSHLPKYKGITANYLRSILTYNPKTGEMRWKSRKDVPAWWNKRYAGKLCGRPDTNGYWYLTLTREYKRPRYYRLHILAWCMQTGGLPTREIDHKDGDILNNRFKNLRLSTTSQNCFNQSKRISNTSGFKGVSFHKKTKKWQANIRAKTKTHYLGLYASREEAAKAYKKAAIRLHGEFHRL